MRFLFRSVLSRRKRNGHSMHKKWKWDGTGDGDGQATERAVDYILIVASTKGYLESLRKPKDASLYPSDRIWRRSESIGNARSIDCR